MSEKSNRPGSPPILPGSGSTTPNEREEHPATCVHHYVMVRGGMACQKCGHVMGEPERADQAAAQRYVPQAEAPVGKLIRATSVLRGSLTARMRGQARAEYAALREVERLLRRHENVLLDPEVPDALDRLDRVREDAGDEPA